MKIYTKTGDEGETSLYGGSRRGKDDLRVASYGNVDELNSALGLVLAHMKKENGLRPDLVRVQHHLFRLGATLADPTGKAKHKPVGDEEIATLERAIDEQEEQLPPLKQFILPGGSPAGASLHQARSVCRRAERIVVELARSKEEVPPEAIRYLNRLSDFLFVFARAANRTSGVAETEWDGEV